MSGTTRPRSPRAVRRRALAIAGLFACGRPTADALPQVEAAPTSPTVVALPQGSAPVAPPRPAVAAPPTAARADLRVATYNILAGTHGLDEVIAALRAFDADLVALQEVDSRTRRSGRVDQPQVIADALGMEVAFVEHRRFDGGRIGVALLSRHPLADVERIALPDGVLAALRADVTIAGRVVHVFVVHLRPTDPRDSLAQQRSMDVTRRREAEAVLLRATADDVPTIVLGDFNARSNSPEYAAFADHFADACPDGGATWPASVPLVRIDYVWTSDALDRVDCPRFEPRASDHRPVVADLRFAAGWANGSPRLDTSGSSAKPRR